MTSHFQLQPFLVARPALGFEQILLPKIQHGFWEPAHLDRPHARARSSHEQKSPFCEQEMLYLDILERPLAAL